MIRHGDAVAPAGIAAAAVIVVVIVAPGFVVVVLGLVVVVVVVVVAVVAAVLGLVVVLMVVVMPVPVVLVAMASGSCSRQIGVHVHCQLGVHVPGDDTRSTQQSILLCVLACVDLLSRMDILLSDTGLRQRE